ncbi:glutamate--cysteine ligase [Brevibacterium daeguense]|uniref:Putative glutamate--cysteine ligase 2 n=1 Tax=Brevibacterium daeguense TaxID=909936 RepID=A0ABP8EJ24_9MICO|nr:glutamate--cysteine ligase [Brevibacterium daeguense]
MRTFGVEEEFLIVDPVTRQLIPVGRAAVEERNRTLTHAPTLVDHQLTVELQQEQIETICPPQETFEGQLRAIRLGRRMADEAVSRFGGRVVALSTSPVPATPHPDTAARSEEIVRSFQLLAREQMTCGLHTHVRIEDRDEGVVVLDRIRRWLPVILALSANSPYWLGQDTGFSSYRRQVFGRWPTTGPTELYGSADAYAAHRQSLLDSGVALDPGMLYFDARLSENHPTVEIRIADMCLQPEHAAGIATTIRALVETAVREHQRGEPLMGLGTTLLQAWSWQAARVGIRGPLIDPASGRPRPAAEVVDRLLVHLRPVLDETGDRAVVEAVVADILRSGNGAARQRGAYAVRGEMADVVESAIALTHSD